MRFQIKSIFKNKITWIVLLFLSAISAALLVSQEYRNKGFTIQQEKEGMLLYWENEKIAEKTNRKLHRSYVRLLPDYEEKKELYANSIRSYGCLIELVEEKIALVEEVQGELPYDRIRELELLREAIIMDMRADPEKGRPCFEDVFPEQRELIQRLRSLPVDTKILYLARKFSEMGEEVKEGAYNAQKKLLERAFYLEEKDLVKDLEKKGLMTYLTNIFSVSTGPSLILPPLILLFTAIMIREEKKNRSIHLFCQLPQGKKGLLKHYYLSLVQFFAILFFVAFAVPCLYLMLRYGSGELQDIMVVYKKGFTSFQGYEKLWSYNPLVYPDGGYGYFEGVKFIPTVYDNTVGRGWVLPLELEFIQAWKFLLLVGVLMLLKLSFYVLLGLAVSLPVRKRGLIYPGMLLAAGVTVFSYGLGRPDVWNPLEISGSWDTALGITNFTWLQAVCMLVVGNVVLYYSIKKIIMKKEILE